MENLPTFVVSIPSNANVFDAVLTARTTRSFSSGQPDFMIRIVPAFGGFVALATAGLAFVIAETVTAAPNSVDTENTVPLGNIALMIVP
ncbi:hypothetical protein FC419_16180 [Bordetella pertussis]